MRILRKGMTGSDVKQWQEFLNGQGFGLGVADGQFGNRTAQATAEFQRQNGLGDDGVVGGNTLNKAKELGFVEDAGAGAGSGGDAGAAGAASGSTSGSTASVGSFNEQTLAQIMPNLKGDKRAAYFPFLASAMQEFGITTPLRQAAFVAQLAHESAEFRFMEEIWGPTAAQKRYEGRKDLGNVQPGDGFRFKGRGPIQITGRFNYQKYGDMLGVDIINNPALAATPEVGFRTAGLYWKQNNLNQLADQQKFVAITKAINGGTNGLDDRTKYYERAKRVLGVSGGFESLGGETRGLDEKVERSFTRGLDQSGENTPTASERNAEQAAAEGTRGPGGGKAPAKAAAKPSGGGAGKAAAKKGAAKKGAGKKAPAAKAAAAKSASKKSPAKKSASKPAAKKSPAKKSAAKKSPAKSGAKKGTKAAGKGAKAGASKKSAKQGASRKSPVASKGGARKGAGGAAKSAARRGAAKKGAKGSKAAKRGARGR